MTTTVRTDLAHQIAGEITLSDDPGATMKKWRTDFNISQTELAAEIDVSSSVISDYESGRRESPGIGIVRRLVSALLDIDEDRGGRHIRQYGRVLSAGFDNEIVHDLREYPATLPMEEFYDALEATEITSGKRDYVNGHTVINSIQTITRLSNEEFYRLYGQSTDRGLVFTGVTGGEGPLVAMRVVTPTPNAVVLHGIEADDLWEHAAALAEIDGFSLATSTRDLDDALADLRELA